MLSCNSQVLVHPLVHPLVRPICQVLDGSSGIAVYPKELVALWCACKGDGSVMEVGTSFDFTYTTVQKNADGEPMYDSQGGFAPAVIEGKGLRNDVAYSNELPVGAEDFQTGWTLRGVSTPTLNTDGSYRVTLGPQFSKDLFVGGIATSNPHSLDLEAKLVSGSSDLFLADSSSGSGEAFTLTTDSFTRIDITLLAAGGLHHLWSDSGTDLTVDLRFPMAVNDSCLHSYIKPGDSQSSTAGVHMIDMEEYKDVDDYVQLSGVI